MYSRALNTGRTFGVVFEPGEDFFSTLQAFSSDNQVRQGDIPMFLAAFSQVEIVGTARGSRIRPRRCCGAWG